MPDIKWKVELTKFSTNSPVVWGEHLFMTSADDEAFEVHEQQLRATIRSHYKLDPPDTTKLRMAID